MRRAFWFCPENDIALSTGQSNFTPPHQAALLARYGAPIMWWLGRAGDIVLVPSNYSKHEREMLESWKNRVVSAFGSGPDFTTSIHGERNYELHPWGWSPYAGAHLIRFGANEAMIPDTVGMRELSHRKHSHEVTEKLLSLIDFGGFPMPEIPMECRSVDDVNVALQKWGEVYGKTPWSSSGRGVFRSEDMRSEVFLHRCVATIRKQGSVMVEKAYHKIADFAMLLESNGMGIVSWRGMSLFDTERHSAYSGNFLMSDDAIWERLGAYVPLKFLLEIKCALCEVLSEIYAHRYRGPLGVDMMIVDINGQATVVPCVEVNVRYTMGFVAHSLAQKTGRDYSRVRIVPGRGERENGGSAVLSLVPENPYFRIEALM